MKDKIEALRTAAQRCQEAQAALGQVQQMRGALAAEESRLKAGLAGVPIEALALPAEEGKPFDAETTRRLRRLEVIRTKLGLAPGVESRCAAEATTARDNVSAGVKVLVRHCRAVAAEQMEVLRTRVATDMLSSCGGDADRAKAAADFAVDNSEAKRWCEAFRFFNHRDDPVEDAQAAIEMAESFEQGEPCA